jgi:8-oxo-dGTP diphosphatase
MTHTIVSHDSETPAVGQQVIVATAFIHRDFDGVTKVYLPQRAMTKKFFPGVFELPGGHVDFGEQPIEGVKREIKEEFKKDVLVGDAFNVMTYMKDVKGAQTIEVTYFAQFTGGVDDIALDPADHMDGQWFAETDYETFTVNRAADDPLPRVIMRGFALIRGERLAF